jgi:hypothetical protein
VILHHGAYPGCGGPAGRRCRLPPRFVSETNNELPLVTPFIRIPRWEREASGVSFDSPDLGGKGLRHGPSEKCSRDPGGERELGRRNREGSGGPRWLSERRARPMK